MIRRTIAILMLVLACCALQSTRPGRVLWSDDFQKAEEGKVPEGAMRAKGGFAVAREDDNKFLRAPADPIEPNDILIGPEKGATAIAARARSWSAGKRTPEFGIGLAGVGGYRLWVMPAVGELQILRGEETRAAVAFAWKSGAWTMLRMRMREAGPGRRIIEGKAWEQGQAEPVAWMVSFEGAAKPPTGRASLSAAPYSEKPVDFDDVTVGDGE